MGRIESNCLTFFGSPKHVMLVRTQLYKYLNFTTEMGNHREENYLSLSVVSHLSGKI